VRIAMIVITVQIARIVANAIAVNVADIVRIVRIA
jgi:hypothetical protein